MRKAGIFVLYDFSPGRHSLTGDALANWFTTFEQKFPWPPGWQPIGAEHPAADPDPQQPATSAQMNGIRESGTERFSAARN
jgi:hypothetical protein